MPEPRVRLLILGGTGEASALARRIVAEMGSRVVPISSLAGRLPDRPDLPGEVRVGGFGGAEGLAAYLRDERIEVAIDATHPFATAISAAAADACAACGVPRLMLVRPAWVAQAGDRWLDVGSFQEAAAMLPGLARRVFLATGPGGSAAFAGLTDIWFLLRLFAPSAAPLSLDHCTTIVARPPFTPESERALLAEHRIEALVCKNSGGPTAAKLVAARAAAIPVVMLRRPLLPAGEIVTDVDATLRWLRRRC
ncbi:MAG: cobalt-precorrin-6A reductase [Rhodospirillales bacterium]|nr:cobalt-precorrin-6A reductase [Rhodospirillales bacterium]